MPWPEDMFAGVGGPASPGSLDTYGLGMSDEDHLSTLAAIDAQLRGETAPPPATDQIDATTAAAPQTLPGTQPGTGIPLPTFDASVRGIPHEQEVDARTDASADRQLARPTPDVKPDYQATPLDLPTQEERDAALQKLSPVDLAKLETQHELKRRYDEAAAMAEASRKEAEQADLDRAVAMKRQEAHAQELASIQAEAKRLADTDVDPEGWQKSRTVGQSIAGLLSVVIGGFGGGPNTGLSMINNAIERHIEAQRTNLANKRAALGERRQALGDQAELDAKFERDANAYRIATYERAVRDIATQQMQYDPNGTTAIALEKSRRAVIAEQAKAIQKAAEDAANRQAKQLKDALEARKTLAETAKLEAEAAKLRGALGGAGTAAKKTPAEFAALGLPAPPVEMSDKEYKAWLANKNSAAGLEKTQQEIATNKTTMSKEERENSIPGIKNEDGSPFIATGRPEDVSKLKDQKSATDTIVARIDDALRVRTGWSSDVGNSEERQKLKVIWGNVKLAAKELYDLGAITASDVPLIEGAIGTDDPSSWRDPTPSMLEARRQVIERINTKLHGAGWQGRYDVKAPPTSAPKETADDAAYKNALRPVKSSDVLADAARPDDIKSVHDIDPQTLDTFVRSDVQRMLDELVDRGKAAKDDAAKEAVLEQLRALVKTGGNTGTKDAARRALALVEGGDLTPEEEARRTARKLPAPPVDTLGGPRGSVSYETVPPAPGGK